MTWSMQTRPRIGRRRPRTVTSAAGPVGPVAAWRGTPSPYPAGTSPSVVGPGATQVWP